MKKGFKGLIKTGVLVTLASVTILAATGCTLKSDGIYKYKYIENEYIVGEENDIHTLHTGSAEVIGTLVDYLQSGVSELSFDCGGGCKTNQFVSYPEMPDERKYDEKCEHCFN